MSRKGAAIVAVAAILAGSTAMEKPRATTISTGCQKIHRPTTPAAFLENIRQIYKCRLLDDNRFYSTRNLLDIFGGGRVHAIGQDPLETLWIVDHLGSLFQHSHQNAASQIDVVKKSRLVKDNIRVAPTVIRAFVTAGVGHDDRLTVALAEQVFGPPDEITLPPEHGGSKDRLVFLPRKTNPLGYQALFYRHLTLDGTYTMRILLTIDATIESISLRMERE